MADELLDAGPVHSALDLDPRLSIVTCACGAVFGIAPRPVGTGLPLILREHRAMCSRAPVSTSTAVREFADWIEAGGFTSLSADRRLRRVELLRAAADQLDLLEAAQYGVHGSPHVEPPAEPGAPPAAAVRLSWPSVEHDGLEAERRWTLAEGAVLQLLLTGEPGTVMRLGSPAQFESLAAEAVDVVRRIVR